MSNIDSRSLYIVNVNFIVLDSIFLVKYSFGPIFDIISVVISNPIPFFWGFMIMLIRGYIMMRPIFF